jgi:hypothetical protein
MGTPYFNNIAAQRLQLFIILYVLRGLAPRMLILSEKLKHALALAVYEYIAWYVQILSRNWTTDGKLLDFSFTDTGRNALLRLASRFESG